MCSSDLAGEIIRRLREFTEKADSNRTSEDLKALIEEAIGLGIVGTAEADVKFHIELDANLPAIFVDKIQIQQVLVNLMRNAIEAMQKVQDRTLGIAVTAEGNQAEIAIRDTGPGLAPEVAARLFQPFVTTKKSGMGVGLSICHSIVQSHGGRIWATVNDGPGVTFHVSLPPAGAEA